MMLSIVIPYYRFPGTFEENLKVLNTFIYKYEDVEVIVVENCKRPSNLPIEFFLNKNKIKNFHFPKKGRSQARNFGAQQSQGEFLLFLDANCLLLEKYFERLYTTIHRLRTGFQFFQVCVQRMKMNDWATLDQQNSGLPKPQSKKRQMTLERLPTLNSACFAVSKSAFMKIGRFDERLSRFEDRALGYNLFFNHILVFPCNNVVCYKICEKSTIHLFLDGIKDTWFKSKVELDFPPALIKFSRKVKIFRGCFGYGFYMFCRLLNSFRKKNFLNFSLPSESFFQIENKKYLVNATNSKTILYLNADGKFCIFDQTNGTIKVLEHLSASTLLNGTAAKTKGILNDLCYLNLRRLIKLQP